MNKEDRIQKVNQAIEWVGLTNKRNSKPNMLSGGECQRTAIARALVHDPVLVMADEPTANLDAENSHNIMKILTKLNKELDTSFVFATHDEKIMGYLKRIIRLKPHVDDSIAVFCARRNHEVSKQKQLAKQHSNRNEKKEALQERRSNAKSVAATLKALLRRA